jgi:hypothetical protein
MNKRQILASLNDIANSLDNSGLYKEANALSSVMKKVAQQAPQPQQAYGQQNPQQINPQQTQQLLNENKRLIEEFTKYSDKCYNLFIEANRKIDAGIQMQEKNGVLNATIMMNQMIVYMQPLAYKIKNNNVQLGYDPKYSETRQELLNAMIQYSNNINNKYTIKKRTQSAQQPVKPQ